MALPAPLNCLVQRTKRHNTSASFWIFLEPRIRSGRKFATQSCFYRVHSVLSYDTSVSIAATRASVWRVLAAVAEWPQWLPTVNSVEPLDAQSLSPGARYKIVQPKLRPATWLVTDREPPRCFAWESRSPGVVVMADHIIDEPSPGRSHLVLRISYSGWLGVPVGMLVRSITQTLYCSRSRSA